MKSNKYQPLKLAMQFIKKVGGYTILDINWHYTQEIRRFRTDRLKCEELEAERKEVINDGFMPDWMIEGNRFCENCGEAMRYHVGVNRLCKNPIQGRV